MTCYAYVGHATVGAYVECRLASMGWTRVDNAADADVAVSYCVSATALEDAYFDESGLVKRCAPGTLLVDLSPSTPSFSRELSAVSEVNDLRMVEAPISIIDPAASDAFSSVHNIMCFVAGDEEVIDEYAAMFDALAATVVRTGAAGTGQLMKAARTVQEAARIASSIEAEALVRETKPLGISLDVANGLWMTESENSETIVEAASKSAFKGTYTVEMLMGEVAAAMTAADEAGLILPQLESVMHLLEVIAVIGGADMAPVSLALMYREEADSASQGLDWTRAEGLFADYGEAHDHNHGDGFDDDELGLYGGFGGYSSN